MGSRGRETYVRSDGVQGALWQNDPEDVQVLEDVKANQVLTVREP